MTKLWSFLFLVLASGVSLGAECTGCCETAAAGPAKKLKVLVISGGHGFPVEPFRKVFASTCS
jgi:hypothetical protein